MAKNSDPSSKLNIYLAEVLSPVLDSGRLTSIIPFTFRIEPGKSKVFFSFKNSEFTIIIRMILPDSCL